MNTNHMTNYGYASQGTKTQEKSKGKVQRGRQLQVSDLDW
jgi:hypothetical protein